MVFEYPSFLYALFAILIPIIIHLFNLRRPIKVFFSNVNLLKEVEQQTSKKLKIKHWLILLSRILFIISLVLAFAKPYIPTNSVNKIGNNPYFSIYLDNSLSMSLSYTSEISLFQQGIKELNLFLSNLPRNSKIQILDNTFNTKSLLFLNIEQAKDYLTELSISNLSRSYEEIYSKQLQSLSLINSNDKNIVWLSDFQKNTQALQFNTDTTIQHYFVPILGVPQSNLFVDSVALSTPFVRVDEVQNLEVWIKNGGREDANAISMQLFLGERQIGLQTLDVKAKTIQKHNINFITQQNGFNKLKIILNDNAVPYDNEFILKIDVGAIINVFEIGNQSEGNFQKIYQNEPSFKYQFSKISNLDYSQLMKQNLIVLNELSEYDNALVSFLNKYVENGGNLAIIPSTKKYTIFNDFNIGFITQKDTVLTKLEMVSQDNLFFEGVFLEYSSKIEMPYFKQYILFQSKGNTLMQFNNGISFFELFNKKDGKIFAFSAPFNKQNSSIFNHSWIVPLSFKMAMNSSSANKKIYNKINDDNITLNYIDPSNQSLLKLKSPELEMIPFQRKLNGKTILNLPKNQLDFNFYDVKNNDSIVDILAFNSSNEESNLDFYTGEEIQKLAPNANVILQKGEINFSDTFQVQNFGLTLWKYCLIMSLLFLAIEIVLIRIL